MRIGIVGLGLIGGSLGLDLRALGHQVYGIARRPDTCVAAVTMGAVDSATSDLASLAPVELVIICTPIAAIAPTVQALVPHLSPETVVTDVGSVKGELVKEAAAHWPWFVGGHPMAGKAEAGLAAAETHLFVNRAYVVTPLETTPAAAIALVQALAQSLRAKVLTCSPADHDLAVAWISHLPVMVSSSLIQACLQEPDETVQVLAQSLASTGFASTSRVGGGNPELGLMMARYNREALLRSLHSYQTQLASITHLIETEQWSQLEATLAASQQARPEFL
ncbi:MAG: prephenate/arogenate dehydrogenase [Cyanobacteria bacterium]|nr:prephenate/arogenate dehydrogenase [Cyanobacteriota bacterium]MDA0864859.1 prephenate/arogenate dehydrogenase [Cyanobacteriota bacterium]